MRTRALIAVLATASAAATMLTAAPAHAAGSIHLYKIYYNSPGSDTGSNTSLNAEYVQIRNTKSYAVQLQGYTITDNAGYKYTFPSYKISAGKTVKVHTGKGTKSPGHVYWGRSWYVWNNTSDKATLRTASGTFRDSCSYSGSSAAYKMC